MLRKDLFKRPKNELESGSRRLSEKAPDVPEELCEICPSCGEVLFTGMLDRNFQICPKCGHYFRMSARKRIAMLADESSFHELYGGMLSKNRIQFPHYEEKLKKARLSTGEREGVVCGEAKISGFPCALFAMEADFMMGSMGTVVGEKITRLFEYATAQSLPVVGCLVSGGARMQEGILSLMQMAKTSGAVKLHSDAGNLFLALLTDPTTGGVTASFGMEADIILAEPKSLIGFAGPRVIEQTIRQKLPAGFQRAEFLQEKGFVDLIVERSGQKSRIAQLLSLHAKGEPA
jgi:acetyl-CoA carboxylase, carboxyl transferase, beta subunit